MTKKHVLAVRVTRDTFQHVVSVRHDVIQHLGKSVEMPDFLRLVLDLGLAEIQARIASETETETETERETARKTDKEE